MAKRLITAIPLIALLVLAFTLPRSYSFPLFGIMSAAAMVCACHEAYSMMDVGKKHMALACAFSLLMLLYIFMTGPKGFGCTPVFLFMLCSFLLTFNEKPTMESVGKVIIANGLFLFICWSLLSIVGMYCHGAYSRGITLGRTPPNIRHLLLYMIICTKMGDIGAYFIGSATAGRPGGNHKLSPISPGKSWEGLAGGIAFSVLASVVLFYAMDSVGCIFSFVSAVVFGVLAAVVGLIGDLSESMLKRAAGVKDSGKIPGLGGVLDILDSLLFVAPLFYAYVQWKL